MKKLFLLIALFAGIITANAQTATASLQTVQITKLDSIAARVQAMRNAFRASFFSTSGGYSTPDLLYSAGDGAPYLQLLRNGQVDDNYQPVLRRNGYNGNNNKSVFKDFQGYGVFNESPSDSSVFKDRYGKSWLRNIYYNSYDYVNARSVFKISDGSSVFAQISSRIQNVYDNTAYCASTANRLYSSGSSKTAAELLDSIFSAVNRVKNSEYGVGSTPQTYGYETWGEAQTNFESQVATSVGSLDTKITLGQNTKSASIPVTVASDQGALSTNATMTEPSTPTTVINSFSFSPASSASVISWVKPSAGTGYKINYIKISGTQTTGGYVVFKLLSLNTLPTGSGTTNSVAGINIGTGVSQDINTVYWCTSNPSGGAAVEGTASSMGQDVAAIPAPGTLTVKPGTIFDFRNLPYSTRPTVTTSGTRAIAVAMEGVTLTGGVLRIEVCYDKY